MTAVGYPTGRLPIGSGIKTAVEVRAGDVTGTQLKRRKIMSRAKLTLPRINGELSIDSHIAPPAGLRESYSGKRAVYPFAKMKKGDSFFIPCAPEHHEKVADRAYASAMQFSRRNDLNMRFGTEGRTEKGEEGKKVSGVRFWRLS